MSACLCGLGFNPACNVDHAVEAEREQQEIADVKSILFGLRAFREDAECDADMAAYHVALDHEDLIEARRLQLAVWDAHADSLIDMEAREPRHPISAAHIVKRRFQRDEARMFPLRSAGTAPYGAAIPGSAPAERSLPNPAAGDGRQDAEGLPVAGSHSSESRIAA